MLTNEQVRRLQRATCEDCDLQYLWLGGSCAMLADT